jgi:hypothetical protein
MPKPIMKKRISKKGPRLTAKLSGSVDKTIRRKIKTPALY